MKNPEEKTWWRLNPKKDTLETIEWTPSEGGVVRGRVDSITPWSYELCGKCRYALSYGERIISQQKRRK